MATLLSRVGAAFSAFSGVMNVSPISPRWEDDPAGLYELLRAHYAQNGLYEGGSVTAAELGLHFPALRNLRSPVNRVVEFYVSHLWGELEIEAESDAVTEAIEQVWKWSNWDARRLLAARWFARDGDLFLKVVSQRENPEDGIDGRVYFQLLDAAHVIDFDADPRGNVTYIHLEVDRVRRRADDGDMEEYKHVEIWDQRARRTWELKPGEERRGSPAETVPLSQFGIDFVPIVHAKFRDIGEKRGQAAATHAIEKIREVNLVATRLHQLIYRENDVTWALSANGTDAFGDPLPPPQVNGIRGTASNRGDGTVDLGGDRFIALPGNSTIQSLVPNINYYAALAVVDAMVAEVERDLPELVFHRLREQGTLSGRAIRLLMGDAIAKIAEARSNIEQALIRADKMALTMGKAAGIDGFGSLGDFEDGSFDHTFALRDAIPIAESEHWETEESKARAAVTQQDSGISIAETLRQRGYTPEQIEQMQREREAEMPEDNALDRAFRGMSADDAAAIFSGNGTREE